MGFRCDAAECSADSGKNVLRYPWMRDVVWVKWPKQPAAINRWKRLIRRGGKDPTGNTVDELHIDRRSRLCSRHFDRACVTLNNDATADPKYFAWNNWGRPVNPRPLPSRQTRDATTSSRREYSVVVVPSVPDVGSEIVVDEFQKKNDVGKMIILDDCKENLPPPADHDYMHTVWAPPKSFSDAGTQTSMTVQDIDKLEADVQAVTAAPNPVEELVSCVTDSDERVNYYTGIPSVGLLNGLFASIRSGADNMKYWRNSCSSEEKKWEGKPRPGRKRKLDLYFEFIMTLLRLRLDLPMLLLADLFCVSSSKVSEITTTWICYLHQTIVPTLLKWPSQEHNRQRMPLEFRQNFPRTRAVIDCTEFFIDRPANKTEQYQTYSSYKSHNTYKCLVAVSPYGAFTYISDLWSGNVSDKYVTEHCGFLDLVEEGDQIMADRGFRIEDLLLQLNATLVAPAFTRQTNSGKGKKKRLNVKEIRQTRLIARLRIHVERAIQRMKTWRILKHQIPASLQNMATMITKVVAALCNLKGPLFYSSDERHMKSSLPRKRKPVKRLRRTFHNKVK